MAYALEPHKALTQYGHRAWHTTEGLPQNSVQTILQTRDGYLWLGTQEGIARFDGTRFAVFDTRNTPGLRNDNVFRLLEDRAGNLWVGTGGGGLSRLRDGRVVTYTTKDGLPSDMVHALHQDRAGDLWIGTAAGLCRLRNGAFTAYAAGAGLSGERVWAVHEDSRGYLWVGTERGLFRLRDGHAERYTTKDGLSSDNVRCLYEDRQGSLWIGTSHGLNRLKDGLVTAHTAGQVPSGDTVLAISEDREGSLWLGTETGLVRLRDGHLSRFLDKGVLSRDRVWAIHEDREGSLWIGTMNAGLHQLKDQKVTTFTTDEGLAHDVVWSVLEARDGAVWIGTAGGGLSRLANGRFQALTTRDGLPSDSIYSLWQDRTGALWIGTLGGGLGRLSNGKLVNVTSLLGGPGPPVRAIYEDREGALWFGRGAGGLVRWKDGRATTYTKADGLSSESIFALTGDAEGNLWIGTFGGGLNRFRDGRLTSYGTRDGLSSDVILSLYSDPEGTLWIGTNGGGLNRFRGGKFTAFTTAHGLFDDVVFVILPDQAGHLWMSSNRGISRVSIQELRDLADGKRDSVTSVAYGEADGMRSRECNGGQHPAGWRSRDGKLWFPTTHGVAVVDPDSERKNHVRPPVHIERVLLDGRPLELDGEQLELPAAAKSLEILYTALSFRAPERVEFKHRLIGFDDDWVRAGPNRTAHYTNLAPGRYRFVVMASNDDGVWNQTGASVSLVRRAHLYRTNGFYAICVALAGLASFGAHRLRIRRLQARERTLADLVALRTRELADANTALNAEAHAARSLAEGRAELLTELDAKNKELDAFSHSVSHDLRAPLRSIDGFSQALLEDCADRLDEDGKRHLRHVRESAQHMAELIDGLLALTRVTRSELRREHVDLSRLARDEAGRLEDRSGEPGRRVDFVVEDGLSAEGDVRLLALVLQNLLGNAWKFTSKRPQGRIEFGQSLQDGRPAFFVRDDGAGFDMTYAGKLFGEFQRLHAASEFEGHGIGLATVQRIVRRHGGRVWAVGKVGAGATFYFTIADGEQAK